MNPCLRLAGRAAVVPAILAFCAGIVTAQVPADRHFGFAPAAREAQRRFEAAALAVPTPDRARAWLHALTEEPHVAGTPSDRKTAEFVRDKLRSWGWTADLVEYEVLLNYPVPESVRLELIRPGERRALPVTEEPHPADKDSASPDAWPAFHGYGVSGEVEGQVVYANYGRPEDFEALERLGVSVEGRIVLVRYGAIFRGLKVLNAQRRGAIGVLIYSDPADDGYAKGDVYPAGPFRPGSAIQRGSVQFLSLGPGDPSTPGVPSTADAKRLPIDRLNGFPTPQLPGGIDSRSWIQGAADPEAVAEWEEQSGQNRLEYFAAIPSLPISYDAARPILEALAGPNVPAGWQGGLSLAYHVGPGPAEVAFAIHMDYEVRPVWNVIARLEGSAERDRLVLIGNHRDAWTYGAVDPSSGTAATLETCRALGEAVKAGWKPRRTILYASWDAEEYGLVGSTEWAEEHARDLDRNAVLMLNVDAAVGGTEFGPGGVPSLRDLLLSAAADVTDPRDGRTIADAWLAARRAAWAAEPAALDDAIWSGAPVEGNARGEFRPQLAPLGSGSDYTAFLDHLGIPALDVDFGGRYGVYHSIYDNFFWMEKFGDPEFLQHATAAKLYTLIAMRAASADVVSLRFTPYAEAIRDHVDDLRRIVVGKERRSGRAFDFAGLGEIVAAVRRFDEAAREADRAASRVAGRDGVEPAELAAFNDALTRVERAFLLPDGLPGRPWFKHAIYAPGLTTGYASWPLPGVRQAILEENPEMLAGQAAALVERLDAAADALRRAARLAGE